MKSITTFVILALAATTWAVTPPGKLGFLFNIHATLTATYSAFSNYRMLKSKENLEDIYFDWSNQQSGGQSDFEEEEEEERLRRIKGL